MTHDLHRLLAASGIHPPDSIEGVGIRQLAYDSRSAGADSLFFALPGTRSDGAGFARDAVARGARAIVAESPIAGVDVPVALVPDARAAMAEVASVFFEQPAGHLRTIAVTGTNGKTTTAFLAKHLCDSAMLPCGLIGTVRYVVGDRELPAARTTPEAPDVQKLLSQMVDAGARAVAMEVSSHAIVQKRAASIPWDAAVFTNLTRDHLDYHKTMDAYFDAKASLFDQMASQSARRGRAVVNADDRYGTLLLSRLPQKLKALTFGHGVQCDFRASNVRFDAKGSTYSLDARGRQYLVRLPLIGRFNVSNSLAALTAVAALGVEVRKCVAALADAPQVPGRLERVPAKRSFQVFVDYAHTDDALENVLATLRELKPSRLLVVFGCGGDRDRAKRPLMGRVATKLADYTILTSDNPRSEDPAQILAEIEKGVTGSRHEIVPDRADAIHHAVDLAAAGDIVLIAGKGHENYQEIDGRRTPFDDVSVARNAIEQKPVSEEI